MTTRQHTQERRREARLRCLKGGQVVLGNGMSTMAGRIRNQSSTGLRMVMDEAHMVPRSFILMRTGNDGQQHAQACEMTWRRAGEFGARIVADSEITQPYPAGRPRQQNLRYPV